MNRFGLGAILLATFILPFTGCGSSEVDSISISPAAQTLTAGQTVQFTASGSYGHGNHPSSISDVTNLVTWTSSSPAIATINASGMATAVSAGTSTITASMKGFTGVVSATATVSVSGGGATTGGDVVSLSVIPGTQAIASPSQTSQFLAIGTTSSGATEDVTNQVTWTSSSNSIATITPAGVATAINKGTASITALFTNQDKTVASGTASLSVLAGSSELMTGITLTPTSLSVSGGGQTAQLIALATNGTTGLQLNVTNSSTVTWTSSVSQIASVSATGLVTGKNPGSTVITAQLTNPDSSVISASTNVTVTAVASTSSLVSLDIIPGAISVGDLQGTGNFLAIGTFSTPPIVRDLTNSVTWISSFPDSFPVSTNSGGTSSASGGIVTAYGTGTATIIAEATGSDGSIQTATATFSCPYVLPNPPTTPGSCWTGQLGPLKATLTIFGEGTNTTNWLVTGPSASGTPDVIHCGPGWSGTGGSVCTGIYPIDTTVVLTAPAQSGVAFGGWTNNCTASDSTGAPLPGPVYFTAAGPNYCTISLSSIKSGATNASVGAIFNNIQ